MARCLNDAHRERHILIDGLIREKAVILEDNAKTAPQIRHILHIHVHNIVSVDEKLSLRRQLLTKKHLDERGLACTAYTDNKDKLSLGDFNIHVVERHRPIFIYL